MANVIDVLLVGIFGVPKRCSSKTHSGFVYVRKSIHASATSCVPQSRRLELLLIDKRAVTRDA
jgi:hypothetical protein